MFTGYTPQTIDFLWGIRMNNNREWFLEHKADYTRYLYEPTKALGAELYEPFRDRPGDILKVSRIYKDSRMHPEVPYKESLWISINRVSQDWWAENPVLFFEITPDRLSYGFSLWHPRTVTMADLRADIAARPDAFLQLIRQTEAAVGIPVTAQTYKRPRFQAPAEVLQPWFNWKTDIACICHEDIGEQTFGPELAVRVRELLVKLIPLYDYFNLLTSAEGRSTP